MLHHRGQISFPGGRHEPADHSLLDTALRESDEEIGLNPTHVTVLGQLDDLLTTGSNYLIRPYVGLIPYPYPFKLDKRETDYLIEVPLYFLRQTIRHAKSLESMKAGWWKVFSLIMKDMSSGGQLARS
ncbi:hypothetical protein C2W62_15515 [Candidatus Entotheonella serta]|nr:hypothetical protein C2W62_15515 [Candidatus Entotheonella serta]